MPHCEELQHGFGEDEAHQTAQTANVSLDMLCLCSLFLLFRKIWRVILPVNISTCLVVDLQYLNNKSK